MIELHIIIILQIAILVNNTRYGAIIGNRLANFINKLEKTLRGRK